MALIVGRGRRELALVVAVAGLAAGLAPPPGCGPASAASKEDKVFTVGNYPVEARAGDAVAAKERAIAEAQQAAFRSLLKRIVPVTAYNRIAKLKGIKAAPLIEGFSVRSERNSSTDYIASYDFIFQAESVRRILDREGIPFLDRQAQVVTLVPVYRAPADPGTPEIFTDARGSDSWLYAWKGLDLANALTPLNLQALRREVPADALRALLEGDLTATRAIAGAYGTETLLVAHLEPDLPQKRVKVVIAGRDAVSPFVLRRSYRLDGPDLTYTAELAAVLALGVLEGRWKAVSVRGEAGVPGPAGSEIAARGQPLPIPRPDGTADDRLRIAVEFRSMSEWQQISRLLSETPEVTDLDVEGLSARGARITLRFPEGAQTLAVALARHGLILRQASSGWVLAQR